MGKHIKFPGSSSPLLSWLHGSALSMKTLLVGFLLGLAYVELGKTAAFLTLWGPSGKCLGGEGKGINSGRPGNPQVGEITLLCI